MMEVSVLLFYTLQKVSNPKRKEWAEKVQKELGYELHVMSREEIITSLMDPRNAPLCSSILAIDVETGGGNGTRVGIRSLAQGSG